MARLTDRYEQEKPAARRLPTTAATEGVTIVRTKKPQNAVCALFVTQAVKPVPCFLQGR
jgi:hypothetical protein